MMSLDEHRELATAHSNVARLLMACKQSYYALRLRGSTCLAAVLLEEIRRHEPDWTPLDEGG